MTRETGQLVVDTPARRHNMQNSQPGRYHVGWEGEYASLVGGLRVESPTLIAARFCDELRKQPLFRVELGINTDRTCAHAAYDGYLVVHLRWQCN
ncbi:unnamed protein product [Macrosiphum euphorbiae]|uniref:Uncharacterized protein n=1 Tax=Macrosiphum euphorbiae TaxID=13131 RepID=A0AAV0WTD7_9HEMI|nr:unnamed protein product [Macrosiphum euphorbiae]